MVSIPAFIDAILVQLPAASMNFCYCSVVCVLVGQVKTSAREAAVLGQLILKADETANMPAFINAILVQLPAASMEFVLVSWCAFW